jgi:hypothetical protein
MSVIKLTITVAAAVLALTACGGPVKMGAAATLGDNRISDSTLNGAVSDWQDAYKANPLPSQQLQLADPDSTDRSVLTRLISFQVSDRAAVDQNITVTPAQLDDVVTQVTRGGGAKVFDMFAVSVGVPPQYSPELARLIVINNQLAGTATTQEEAQQKISSALSTAAKELGVKVNPRYGDFTDGQLTAPIAKLSRPETGTA